MKAPDSCLLAAALLAFVSTPAHAGEWNLRAGVELRYDDNVFEYGSDDRDAFDPDEARYAGLASLDDWILGTQFRAEFRSRTAHETRLAIGGSWSFYTRNDEKNYESFSLRAAQELPGDFEAGLRLSLVPDYFLKRLADPPNQSETYANARFRSTGARASLGRRLGSAGNASVWLEVERDDYTRAFDERDITELAGGLEMTADLAPWVRMRVTGSRGEGVARGENDPEHNSDISYTLWTAGTSATFRLAKPLWLDVGYTLERKHFTTGLVRDRSHFRREDRTQVVEVGVRFRPCPVLTLGLGAQHTDTRATRDGERLDFASFLDNLYSLQVSYAF